MYVENNNKGMYYYVAAYNNTQVQLAQKAKHCGAAGLSFLFLVVSCSPLHSATGSIPFSLESLYTNVSWNYMYMTRHQRTNSKQKTKQKSSE